jgi:hypothetical protein
MAEDFALPQLQRDERRETLMRAVLVFAVLLAACGPHQELPRLTVPQIEQARASVEGGIGRRYQDHAACTKTSTDAKSMIDCMQIAGYGYLPRSAETQATECWRLRDANQTEPLPEALCFVHGGAPAN